LKATGAQRAFAVSSYKESPLEDFELSDFDIEAKTVGSIKDDKGWKFTRVNVKTADGSQAPKGR
jgi:hypothetical protein